MLATDRVESPSPSPLGDSCETPEGGARSTPSPRGEGRGEGISANPVLFSSKTDTQECNNAKKAPRLRESPPHPNPLPPGEGTFPPRKGLFKGLLGRGSQFGCRPGLCKGLRLKGIVSRLCGHSPQSLLTLLAVVVQSSLKGELAIAPVTPYGKLRPSQRAKRHVFSATT